MLGIKFRSMSNTPPTQKNHFQETPVFLRLPWPCLDSKFCGFMPHLSVRRMLVLPPASSACDALSFLTYSWSASSQTRLPQMSYGHNGALPVYHGALPSPHDHHCPSSPPLSWWHQLKDNLRPLFGCDILFQKTPQSSLKQL